MTKGVEYVFSVDHDLLSIKRQIKQEFNELFSKAYENYIEGDWLNAQSNLTLAI